jgi:methylated-DNA-[protein]-cysteine S-methyltransferase
MPIRIDWVAKIPDKTYQCTQINTPFYALQFAYYDDVICALNWSKTNLPNNDLPPPAFVPTLADYWQAPQATTLSIKLLQCGTVYQHRVWQALCTIPLGQTISYGALAKRLQSSPRAVANACRANPYVWVVPCHRVVALAGLGGYCGQRTGVFIALKEQLLTFEKMLPPTR